MATNRDERFPQAGLMAEELRALQLRPPAVEPLRPQEKKTATPASGNSGLLPKRPVAQPPRYPGIDSQHALPAREQRAPEVPGQTGQQMPSPVSTYDTSPELPTPPSSPDHAGSMSELPTSVSPASHVQKSEEAGTHARRWRQRSRKMK